MAKNYGGGVLQGSLDFPLTLSDPTERMPLSIKYLNFMADRHMHYGIFSSINTVTYNEISSTEPTYLCISKIFFTKNEKVQKCDITGHVVPNVNLFLVRRRDIMERLIQNKANPTMIG